MIDPSQSFVSDGDAVDNAIEMREVQKWSSTAKRKPRRKHVVVKVGGEIFCHGAYA